MGYKIYLTEDAEKDLDSHIYYLLYEKRNPQAAQNVLDDFEITKKSLEHIAESLQLCDNPRLKKLGYRRINFKSHSYFMLYRIEDNLVIIDNIFHDLQDYEKKMI